MVDREHELDRAALVTRTATRRNTSGHLRNVDEVQTSAAVYQWLRAGRQPYLCVPCDKKLNRFSLATHVKTRHRGKSVCVRCQICSSAFDTHVLAQEHVAAEHKIFKCFKCPEIFAEFDRLKSHLKIVHDKAEWPWICGFCDEVLFYDIEFQVHVRGHTEKGPFTCPQCGIVFEDTDKVRLHLVDIHLEKASENKGSRAPYPADDLRPFRKKRLLVSIDNPASVIPKKKLSVIRNNMKDENAVNREIAALLLNLHASKGSLQTSGGGSNATKLECEPVLSIPKPEDLSIKKCLSPSTRDASEGMAMDLTKTKSLSMPLTTPSVSITKIANHNAIPAMSAAPASENPTKTTFTSSSPAYSFYAPLQAAATIAGLSPSMALNSNYLLQNLLLGKMQQMASTSPTSSNGLPFSATSFPTQPLPATALSIPSSTALKPPPSILKATLGPANGDLGNPTSGIVSSSASIPILCGQIVSQLNGLLFLIHGINSPSLELNLQSQLSAILSRLQDIVTMVEHAKKQDSELIPSNNQTEEAKHDSKMGSKQLHEYQRALLKDKMLKKQSGENSPSLQLEQQEVESTSNFSSRRRRGRPPKGSSSDVGYSPPDKQARIDEHDSSLSAASCGNNLVVPSPASVCKNSHGAPSSGGGGGKGIRNRVFCGECVGCLKYDDCGKCRYCKDKTKFGGQNRLRQKCLHRRCQMDTHRRRASHNGASSNSSPVASNNNSINHNNNNKANSSILANGSSVDDEGLSYDSARQSPSPTAIYSGVDLARLTQVHGKINSGGIEASVVDVSGDNKTRSTSRASNTSDEDAEDPKPGTKSQSRIDKWKAKHEAMLKLAEQHEVCGVSGLNDVAVGTDEDGEDEVPPVEMALSSSSQREEVQSGLDVATNGVCLDFEDKSTKPLTAAHSAIQQVLSV